MDNQKIDFIGIGAAKSGTTWLAKCMAEHPDILMARDKSLFFFNCEYGNQYVKDNHSNFYKGLSWYQSKIPPAQEGKIRGEFGVSYLNDSMAYKRIKSIFPDAKILVSLRNPADMVYSLYWFAKQTVDIKAPPTFEKAVEEKLYLDRGNYYKHLIRFYNTFLHENIHVIIYDDIKSDPHRVIKELFEFLSVESSFEPSIFKKKVNMARSYRFKFVKDLGYQLFTLLKALKFNFLVDFLLGHRIFYDIYYKLNTVPYRYPPMDKKTRKKLIAYYKEDTSKLETLLNKDLSVWKKIY